MRGPLDIAIAGAGPAGLATALYTHRLGHRVTLFERFPEPKPVGSGMILQPTGQAVLQDLGLLGKVAALGAPLDGIAGADAQSGRVVLDMRYESDPLRPRGLGVHRAALFGVLHEAVLGAGIPIATAHPVTSHDGRRLVLEGGRAEGPFDLIVDATGSGSLLRRAAGIGREPRALTFGAFWATTPWVELGFDRRRLEQRYRGASIMAGVLPIGRSAPGGRELAAIFWSVRTAEAHRLRATALDVFKAEVLAVWPAMEPHLAAVADWAGFSLARYGHHTLARPIADGLALVGDAAHSTSPQLGQGANMALLDAKALEAALKFSENLPAALERYVRLRRRHVQLYQALSASLTPFYQSDSRILPLLRDALMGWPARVPPVPSLLRAMVSGHLLWPIQTLGLAAPPPLPGPGRDQPAMSGQTKGA